MTASVIPDNQAILRPSIAADLSTGPLLESGALAQICHIGTPSLTATDYPAL
jgi:hypothetical protein